MALKVIYSFVLVKDLWSWRHYLVQNVVAFLAGGDLDEAVQTLCGLLNENVPATRVILLTPQTHHLQTARSL